MDVSIVVPFCNEESRIERCIRALYALDYPEDRFEILMIDNNSTDASAEIVRRYPRIRMLREAIPGDFAARNRGLAEARGEIVAFTDSDTAPFPDWLRCLVRAFQDPQIQLIVGKLQFAGESRALALLEAYEEEKSRFILSGTRKELYLGYTCNMAVRRRVFDELGPFPPVYRNSDVVLVRKVVDAYSCAAVCYAPSMRVRRLEVSSAWSYFAKQSTYGRDFNRYGKIAAVRPLRARERLDVFRRATRNRGYSIPVAIQLFALLTVGALCYDVSRWLLRPRPA